MAPAQRGAHEEESIFGRANGHDPARSRSHYGGVVVPIEQFVLILAFEKSRKQLFAERMLRCLVFERELSKLEKTSANSLPTRVSFSVGRRSIGSLWSSIQPYSFNARSKPRAYARSSSALTPWASPKAPMLDERRPVTPRHRSLGSYLELAIDEVLEHSARLPPMGCRAGRCFCLAISKLLCFISRSQTHGPKSLGLLLQYQKVIGPHHVEQP